MTYYRFPESRATKALLGLFLFAMLFLARDTLTTSCVLGFYPAQFLMLGIIALAAVVFLIVNRKNLKAIFTDGRILVVLIATAAILIPMVCKRDWQMMYLSILICVYFGVFLSYFLTSRETAKYYVIILSVLAVYSVIATYLLRRIPDSGVASVPMFRNDREVDFYNFGLSYVSVWFVKNRNFGIFREPGVYQYFLILGLYLTQYHVDWKKTWHMWLTTAILAATLVTTLATGGIIELGLLALVVFVDKKLYRDKRFVLFALALAAAAGVVVAVSVAQKNELYWELYDMLIGKFVSGGDSFSERTEAVLVDLKLFLDSPIFGQTIYDTLHAVENNTTSTLILFAVFGIAGGALHVLSWAALAWDRKGKVWVNLAVLVILFMSFNTQNLTADVFFWLFPVMTLTERAVPALRRRKGKG